VTLYQLTRLPNGLTVATAEMPHMSSVSVGLWVAVGSRCEPPELNGACHFIEHLLFKGTRRRSARDISQAVEGIGGYLNAFTSEEATCVHARAVHDRFADLLDVLVDMFVNSRFDPRDIAKERDVIKDEIAMCLDDPQHHVQEILNATLWPDQPLGRPITGTPKTLDSLRRSKLIGFLRDHYVTGATAIVAAGRIRHREVLRAALAHAPRFRKGLRLPPAPSITSQSGPRVRLVTKPTEQTQLALGIRTCSRHDNRRFALRLLNALLGENMSSRLFQALREDRGLAYSIYSTPSFFADTGDLVISAGLDAENVRQALSIIRRELRRMTDTCPGKAELRRARDYVIGQMDLAQESTDNQMHWTGEQLLAHGRVLRPCDIKRRLASLTAQHIRSVARDFFRSDRVNLAIVSPMTNTRGLTPLLHL
jgi:predicted Zn-dependent peptidase